MLTIMSRAFVKDADDVEELPDRPISENSNEVTPEGLQQIEAALMAAREAYAAAQANGDREPLASARRDLQYWTTRLQPPWWRQSQTIIPLFALVTQSRSFGTMAASRLSGSLEKTKPIRRAGLSRTPLL
jgi:hypothetical protein